MLLTLFMFLCVSVLSAIIISLDGMFDFLPLKILKWLLISLTTSIAISGIIATLK